MNDSSPFRRHNPLEEDLREYLRELKDKTKEYKFTFLIPFEYELAKQFTDANRRLQGRDMRDFNRFVTLIKTIAFLNIERRYILHNLQTGESAIIATGEDFEEAKGLFSDIVDTTVTGMSKVSIDFFNKILVPMSNLPADKLTKHMQEGGGTYDPKPITTEEIKTLFYKEYQRPLSKRMLSYYMDPLVDAGWVDEDKDAEDRRKNVYRLNVRGMDPSTWVDRLKIPETYELPDSYKGYIGSKDNKVSIGTTQYLTTVNVLHFNCPNVTISVPDSAYGDTEVPP